jgi:antitoxin HicB
MAQFPDVPEALTEGRSEEHVLFWAQDALVMALAMYVADDLDIPQPSPPQAGQPVVPLPTLMAAKLAIYQEMRNQHLSQLALAERLHCDPRQIRRLLDLGHQSRMDQVEAALRALGKTLLIDVRDLTAV